MHTIWQGPISYPDKRRDRPPYPITYRNGRRFHAARAHYPKPLMPYEQLVRRDSCPYPLCISPECHRVRFRLPRSLLHKPLTPDVDELIVMILERENPLRADFPDYSDEEVAQALIHAQLQRST